MTATVIAPGPAVTFPRRSRFETLGVWSFSDGRQHTGRLRVENVFIVSIRPHRMNAPFPRILLLSLLVIAGCSAAKETAIVVDKPVSTEPVTSASPPEAPTEPAPPLPPEAIPGRFDFGKMWTFDNPPTDYFQEAYDFKPDDNWFERARLGAVRFSTICSAAFVSPNGLIATNHHCGRESVTDVDEKNEQLLDEGYYARHVEDERKVKELYVEQLITIDDVTDKVYAAVSGVFGDEAQERARSDRSESIQTQLTKAAKLKDTTLTVQVVSLYNGAQYSAYTFKRYSDVRLVMAPELQVGFFGGDPDNFTYPRYNLDFAFFRAYGVDGLPLKTEHYFEWDTTGVNERDLVFIVGSPGSTSRLLTVSQLEFERDVSLPAKIALFKDRSRVLKEFIDRDRVEADKFNIRNVYFTLENSIKAWEGQLRGLKDPILMLRKGAADDTLRKRIAESDSLAKLYGAMFDDISAMQRAKRAVADQSGAFTYFGAPELTSHILLRALYGFLHDFLKVRGAPAERVNELKRDGLKVKDWPADVERAYMVARFRDLEKYLGASHPLVRGILGGRSPDSLAAELVAKSALIDSTGFAKLLEKGYLTSGDASVKLIEALAPAYLSMGQQLASFETTEKNINARLARARVSIFGKNRPPDATFTLRLSDGVVSGYTDDGTYVPAFTTLGGMIERHYEHQGREEWALPERWLNTGPEVDLTTPLNFVSTNDITGGSSGSPVLSRDLKVVGIAFDSNLQALPNEYLFRDELGRTVSVDSRAVIEALDDVYDADRIVLELTRGTFYETEEEADAAVASSK